jgi:hypothetical protein
MYMYAYLILYFCAYFVYIHFDFSMHCSIEVKYHELYRIVIKSISCEYSRRFFLFDVYFIIE